MVDYLSDCKTGHIMYPSQKIFNLRYISVRMKEKSLWKAGGFSTLIFILFISVLTALRVWNLEPPTSIQANMIRITTLLIVISVAFYFHRGGNVISGWILAFGPTLSYTLNLFISLSAGIPLKIVFSFIPAVLISGLLAIIGYILQIGTNMLYDYIADRSY